MDAIVFASVTKTFPMNAQRMLARGYLAKWLKRGSRERFVALRNISFRIPRGQTVGVVGVNGAGKSTLLSLVAGLCPPDEGAVTVRGRVSPLLQLGAGFHSDLTGTENVHLNAALLGFTPEKTAESFDQIVEFSGIGPFIDQPARTYSSGMTMRLAFSIAIHGDPDVLIIDEVLAVGDQAFQVKCMDKIQQFRKQGKTLLFVSHSTGAVQKLCERALWLDRGELMMDGNAADVAAAYEDGARVNVGTP
ncbi:MAG: ABC transporter ATP-binding protein [Acidobacteriia bacterium]|nr:ABC transporter ATP-binding protein [Terriglobia bacterium]